MIPTRHFRYAAISLAFASCCAHAADRDVRVLNFEPVALEFGTQSAALQKTTGAANSLRFSAFGTNYAATLETNSAIKIPASSRAQAYRGSLDGRDNSWLRITRVGDEVHGLIFDGTELFAIEPAATIADRPVTGTAIFKLADTFTELGGEFCASLKASEETSGLAIYKSLSGESKTILAQMQKSGARSRLQLSAIMDLALRERFGGDAAASDAIVARVNNMDGIFSSQLGIEVQLVNTIAPETPGEPFLTNTKPDGLLQLVSKLRSESPALYSTGTTHLFTGMDLDGKTIGISYMDSVCGQRYAASLSEVRDRGSWFDALVAAHELGHGFGSPHDGEGECATTPTTFLMAPTINGNEHFSQCSLNRIQTRMLTASCLIPIPIADVSLPAISDIHATTGASFAWTIPVANIGNGDATDTRVQMDVPPALAIISAKAGGGNCAIGGGAVLCDLGTVPAQQSRDIELVLRASQTTSQVVTAWVSALSDATTANNNTRATIYIDPSLDVSIALDVPSTASIDTPISATFTVANKGNAIATNVSIDFVMPAGLTLTATPQFDGIACQVQFQIVRCLSTGIGAGRTISNKLDLVARQAGSQTLTATIEGYTGDPQPLDNASQKTIVVAGPTTVTTANAAQGGQESGGGAFGLLGLGLLSGLVPLRRMCRLPQSN